MLPVDLRSCTGMCAPSEHDALVHPPPPAPAPSARSSDWRRALRVNACSTRLSATLSTAASSDWRSELRRPRAPPADAGALGSRFSAAESVSDVDWRRLEMALPPHATTLSSDLRHEDRSATPLSADWCISLNDSGRLCRVGPLSLPLPLSPAPSCSRSRLRLRQLASASSAAECSRPLVSVPALSLASPVSVPARRASVDVDGSVARESKSQ